ncbi:MAG: TRAP transporter small permease [Desulfobacterium sp.]|nr:TRAP transporter small permease [Desulfobacterium sp.]
MRMLSGIMLVAMMLVTCTDVVGNLFGLPVLGSEEIVSLMAALLIAFVLPAAHGDKAHIGVDILYMKFPPKVKRINNAILSVLLIGFFGLMTWECCNYGEDLKRIGQVSAILEIPTFYVIYAVAFGCGVLTLVLAAQLAGIVGGGRHE